MFVLVSVVVISLLAVAFLAIKYLSRKRQNSMKIRIVEFTYLNQPVGCFQTPPKTSGCYQYEPYRSLGHYELIEQVGAQAKPQCEYSYQNKKRSFQITDSPEPGVLQIENIYSRKD